MRFRAAVLAFVLAGCGGNPSEPSDKSSNIYCTTNFSYYYKSNDTTITSVAKSFSLRKYCLMLAETAQKAGTFTGEGLFEKLVEVRTSQKIDTVKWIVLKEENSRGSWRLLYNPNFGGSNELELRFEEGNPLFPWISRESLKWVWHTAPRNGKIYTNYDYFDGKIEEVIGLEWSF